MGCRIMVGVIQPVGIGKMGIGASKCGCLGIHHLRKLGIAAGHMLCQGIAHFIGRL